MKLNTNMNAHNNLEIELLKKSSSLDEINLKFNDLKHNYDTQLKFIDKLKFDLNRKDEDLSKLNQIYEKIYADSENLISLNELEKKKFKDYQEKVR
jgi:hypothetical protein